MTIEVRIKEDGKWRGPTAEEFTGTLDCRVALLAKKETVIRVIDGDTEVILATGDYIGKYKAQGKAVISLVALSESLRVYPTIDHALKVLGGQILTQGALDL